jgi:cytochrome d ubiquinol oxidase subunit I
MEAVWDTEKGVPLTVIGWPDEEEMVTKYAFKIPKLASVILTHSLDGEIKGLKSWKKEDRPPVKLVFFGFRIMVGIGLLMLFTAYFGVYLFFKKRLFTSSNFHKWCMIISPMGFVAILSGWVVTEVGRQPYIVYGLLRTSEAASNVAPHQVLFTLILFFIVYMFMMSFGVFYIFQLVKIGIKQGDWSSKKEASLKTSYVRDVFIKMYSKV